MHTYITHSLAAVLALVIFGAFAVFAWTGPLSAPPSGNVDAPINVGNDSQVKDGPLSVGGLSVYGGALVTGNVTAAGFFHSSDARLKRNVQTIGGLDLVSKLRGVSFEWEHDGSRGAGVIAQEVEGVLPSAVHTDADGVKSVEYDQLIAPLIEAIKEQQAEIDSLKAEIEQLKK